MRHPEYRDHVPTPLDSSILSAFPHAGEDLDGDGYQALYEDVRALAREGFGESRAAFVLRERIGGEGSLVDYVACLLAS